MPILVRGLVLAIEEPEELLLERAAGRLGLSVGEIRNWAIVRRALDARQHEQLRFTYNVELALTGPRREEARLVRRLGRQDVTLLVLEEAPDPQPGRERLPERPVIVGFGPAGMFAGYMLAAFGYRPLIIDRGAEVSNRHRHIMVDFYRGRQFNPESNLLFGEGGAGAYSDGKLYTRLSDPRVQCILEILYQHGADPDVLIDGRPHIGSDKLPGICRRLRLRIEQLGGQVRFGARLDDVLIRDGVLVAIDLNGHTMPCGPVVLAVGQSARDTLRMISRRGVACELKPFQLGVRIQHPQAMVDRWQYGPHCGHPRLPPATYHLVAKGAAGGRGDLFSFCMCPGGDILPANESPGEIVTNGASRSRRDGPFANCGLVITLHPGELCPQANTDALVVLDYLEQIERGAFDLTGESYRVPVQRASDFLQGRPSDGQLEICHPLGGQWTDIRRVVPAPVVEALQVGLAQLNRRLEGFAGPEALIAAPETRASSPLRLTRDPQTRQSLSTRNLYPVGEGAGYAGGIMSAALDGLRAAEAIIARFAPV